MNKNWSQFYEFREVINSIEFVKACVPLPTVNNNNALKVYTS